MTELNGITKEVTSKMPPTTDIGPSEVSKWVRESFHEENFKSITSEITGSSEKGDGYVGDIAFVKATALTQSDESKQFNLVLKIGKQDEDLRKKMPVRLAYEREIFIYDTTVPLFKRFEEKRNVEVIDTFMPKCFNTLLYDKQEVLVFQNLKAIGYDLHDRFEPFDLNHLKLTFETYGKWHGLSIAFRDQEPEKSNELFGNLDCVMGKFLVDMQESLNKTEKALYTILEKTKEYGLRDRLRKRFKKSFGLTLLDLLNEEEPNSVLLHGDCWNNNMMFRYDDPERIQPKSIKFLDFQLSKLGSPVLDLTYHLYSTASEKELKHFDELLRIYHSSLSNTIKSLGSDPEKLFPYHELLRQWNKYSSSGVVMASMVLPIVLSNREDAIDIQDMDGDALEDVVDKVMEKNYDRYSQRSVAFVKHFLEFNNF